MVSEFFIAWYVSMYHRSSGDHGTPADRDALNDSAAGTQECLIPDEDCTTECHTRGNMYMRTNMAIMVNRCRRIDDAVLANDTVRLQDGSCHDLHTLLKGGAGVHDRSRVNQGWEVEIPLHKFHEKPAPTGIATDQLPDPIDQSHLSGVEPIKCLVTAQHRQVSPLVRLLLHELRIADTDHIPPRSPCE
jgi:hypothetical protein